MQIFSKITLILLEIILVAIIAAIMFSIQGDTLISSIIAGVAATASLVCTIFAFLSWKEKHNQDI